jgi:NAD(P)-dependent dehydrogenase (short-subunit alcohol dehydrogenase family)
MKRALITGGAGAIGRAIARALAIEGYASTVTGLTLSELESLNATDQHLSKLLLDVTKPESISKVMDTFDRLDVLVNCAGILIRNNEEHDDAQFAKVVDVNLIGAMRMCQAAHLLLSDSNGCIINIASMLSFFGSASQPAYSSSKGGVVQLTKSLAIAWARRGIRVNAIAPGWIASSLTAPVQEDDERNHHILERTPMGRWGEPKDVAGTAVFLCSPRAAFITGAVIPVDGGYSCA